MQSNIKKLEDTFRQVDESSLYSSMDNYEVGGSLGCIMCNNPDNGKKVFLECNHVCHINCLVESQNKRVYNFNSIDAEFFNSCKCIACNTVLTREELKYIHSQYISNTNKIIIDYSEKMTLLTTRLDAMQTEIRACIDYKHKLEQTREKSREITLIL